MEALLLDLRQAVRGLRRAPWLSAMVVLSLALGIGANTTVFTFVKAVLLPPLPVRAPQRLVALYGRDTHSPGYFPNSWLNYRDYAGADIGFEGLVARLAVPMTLHDGGRGERVMGEIVSGNYFDVLGVPAALGRGFRPDEDQVPGAKPVVVLGYGLWQRRFASDPGLVGRAITLNGQAFTVVGVAPRNFAGTAVGLRPDVWVPSMMHASVFSSLAGYMERRRALVFDVFGRLRPGVSVAQAAAAMKVVAQRLEQEYPDDNRGRSIALVPLLEARIDPNARGPLLAAAALLLGVVGLVLLIACANVANVMLAKSAERRREMGVRLCLGAGSGRLVRQLLTESLLLAVLGGALGLVAAHWATGFLWTLRPASNIPVALDLAPDSGVLAFTLLVTLLTGLAFGLAPALDAARTDLVAVVKESTSATRGAGGGLRLREFAVVSQVAAALFLLVAAGLFLRSLRNAQGTDPGFRVEGIVVAPLEVGFAGYSEQRGRAFYREAQRRGASLPGAGQAVLAQFAPLTGGLGKTVLPSERAADPETSGLLVQTNVVSCGYFQALGIALVRGRDFTTSDTAATSPVAIVNETLATRLWPGQEVLGRRFRFTGEDVDREIVGVARTVRYNSPAEAPTPYLYLPLEQEYAPWAVLHVAGSGPAGALASALRTELRALDPALPVFDVLTLRETLVRSLWPARMGALLLLAFGSLGLLLAALGVYGVMAKNVAARTREIGIRLALGSLRRDVQRLVLMQSLRLVAYGLGVGLLLVLGSMRLFAGLLYGVPTADPLTLASTSAVLLLAASLACLLPARRAAHLEPAQALRG